jgi:hypothetical protein
MFREAKKQIALFKLRREEKLLAATGKQIRQQAREKNNPEIYDEWYESEARYEYEGIAWFRKRVFSDSVLEEAEELNLPRPYPGEKGKFEEDRPPMVPGDVLTLEVMAELRSAIRKERRERRETFEWWVKILGGVLTLVTGLVGALIGLAAILKHK